MYKNVLTLLIVSISLQVSLFAKDINIDTLAKNLQNSNKHLLIFLHKTGCPYCDKMIEFTLDDETNSELIKNNFVFIDINVKDDGRVTYKDFAGSKQEFAIYMGRNMYPSTLFFDATNTKVFAQTGYVDEDYYFKILQYVDYKAYKTTSLEDFVNVKDYKKRLQ